MWMSNIKDIRCNPRLQDKRVAWFSISMHAYDPVPIVKGLRLAALRAAGAQET